MIVVMGYYVIAFELLDITAFSMILGSNFLSRGFNVTIV